MQVERRHLGSGDHGPDGDSLSIAGEGVTAAGTPRAANNIRAAKTNQDLLDIIDGQTLSGSNVPAGDRPFGRASRQMQGADHAILGQSGNAHDWTLRLDSRSYKASRLSQPRRRHAHRPALRSRSFSEDRGLRRFD